MVKTPCFKKKRLHASTAEGLGLIPGRGTKIPHAVWPKKRKKEKKDNLSKPSFLSINKVKIIMECQI